MQADLVFGVDGELVKENVVITSTQGKFKFRAEALYGVLYPGKVFQATGFASYKFQRRTLAVQSYQPETFEFSCNVLGVDTGKYNDPTISAELLVYQQKDE